MSSQFTIISILALQAGALAFQALRARSLAQEWRSKQARGVTLDIPIEVSKVRSLSVKSLLFQMATGVMPLFLFDLGERTFYFLVFAFTLGAFLNSRTQMRLEKPLRGISATTGDSLKLFVRFFSISLVSRFLALPVMLVPVLLVMFLTSLKGILFAISLVIAFFAGFALSSMISVFVSPILIRLSLPCRKSDDEDRKQIVLRVFERASLPQPQVFDLALDKFKHNNALVAGIRWGRGPFRPAVFISASLRKDLSSAEYEAIIAHEASHIALNHLFKRAWLVAFVPISLVGACGLLGYFLFGDAIIPFFPGFVISLAIIQMVFGRYIVRRQELQADAFAVTHLGAGEDALTHGLAKLTTMNDMRGDKVDPSTRFSIMAAHPTLEERVRALRSAVEKSSRTRAAS